MLEIADFENIIELNPEELDKTKGGVNYSLASSYYSSKLKKKRLSTRRTSSNNTLVAYVTRVYGGEQ
jgi:hypothetical protein